MITFEDPSFLGSVARAAGTDGDEVQLLISSMSDNQAEFLKVCAIPHYCDLKILRAMMPERDESEIHSDWTALRSLCAAETISPIIGQYPTIRIFDAYRRQILEEWLHSSDNLSRFRQLNERAANYWRSLVVDNTRQTDRLRREIIYHELAASPGDGTRLLESACRSLIVHEQPAEARALLAYALELKAAVHPELLARINILEADVLASAGQLDEARVAYEAALSRDHGSGTSRVKLLLSLAAIDVNEEIPHRAESLYRQALSLLKQQYSPLDTDEWVAASLGLGAALARTGKSAEARDVLRNALNEDLPPSSAARVQLELGLLLRDEGDVAASITAFQQALRELPGTSDPELEAGVWREYGLALEHMSDWASAETAFRSSLHLFDRADDTMAHAQVLADLARISWRQKNLPEAADLADEAGKMFESVRADAHAGIAQLQAARVLTELRRKHDARLAYEKAESLLRTSGAFELLDMVKDELRSLTRTRRVLGWLFGLAGLSGVAGIIAGIEVEHLYLAIGSVLFVLYNVAAPLWRLTMAAGRGLASASATSGLLVAFVASLVLPALLAAAARCERQESNTRIEEYVETITRLGKVSRSEVESWRWMVDGNTRGKRQWWSWLSVVVLVVVSGIGFTVVFGNVAGLLHPFGYDVQPETKHLAFLIVEMTFLGTYIGVVLRSFAAIRDRVFDADFDLWHAASDLVVGMALGWIAGLFTSGFPVLAELGYVRQSIVACLFGLTLIGSGFSILSSRRVVKMVTIISRYFEKSSDTKIATKTEYVERASENIAQLTELEGIGVDVIAHLQRVNIADVATLATANPLQIFVATRYGIYQILDWVGQALLVVAVPRQTRSVLRDIGVRTIGDLLWLIDRSSAFPPKIQDLLGITHPAELAPAIANDLVVRQFMRVREAWTPGREPLLLSDKAMDDAASHGIAEAA